MSSGQKPRWRAFYPRMKVRGRHRRRKPRIVFYDSRFGALWPQPKVVSWQHIGNNEHSSPVYASTVSLTMDSPWWPTSPKSGGTRCPA